jgi:hypothetical protein
MRGSERRTGSSASGSAQPVAAAVGDPICFDKLRYRFALFLHSCPP